jgi:UDP-N-acetylglucosamine acyltransferase
MPRPANAHPTAIISDDATLPDDTQVGPYAVIEGPVKLGPGCVIRPHAHLIGPLTMGANNEVGTAAVIGGAPQHLGYKGEPTNVEIGDNNIFREHCTVHRGMPLTAPHGSGTTRIGNRNLFMAAAHVGHDCVISNDCIFANSALLGGHVTVADRVIISGNSAIHQFCRVGRLGMLSGVSGTGKDIPPFWVLQGHNGVRGINLVGMRRAGIASAEILAVRKSFRILYLTRPALPISVALARIEAELGEHAAIREVVAFIRESKRGILGAHRLTGSDDDEGSAAA